MGAMINEFHTKRVASLLKGHGGTVLAGHKEEDEIDPSGKFIQPTVIENPKLDSELMKEEIFGPIMPIITFKTIDEAIKFSNARPKPLAAYYFGPAWGKNLKKVTRNLTAGGISTNDVLMHCVNSHLPFGGVGASGYGKYHGITGFRHMSNAKAVYSRAPLYIWPYNVFDWPFTESRKNVVRFFMKKCQMSHGQVVKSVIYLIIAIWILKWIISG
jgi:aldehyde dehydrogenase (NAD+)